MFPLWCAIVLAEPDATIEVTAPVRDEQDTSAVVTVVQVDERLSVGADVADVVAQTPGAVVKRLGGLGDASGVSLRGGGLRDTLVMLDGVPLNPDGGAAVNLTELPLQAFGQVAVYRGGVPSELGANALGGAVDLRSSAGEGPSVWARAGTLHTAGVGAMGRASSDAGRVLVVVDALRTEGDFEWFDDAATPYTLTDDAWRERSNNDSQQVAAHAVLTRTMGASELALLQSVTGSEEGVPGPAGGLTESVRFGVLRSLTSAQLTHRGEATVSTARLWGAVRQESLDDGTGEIGLTAERSHDLAVSLGGRGVVERALSDALRGSAVLDARWDRYQARDEGQAPEAARDRMVLRPSVAAHWRAHGIAIDPVLEAVWVQSAHDARVALTPQLGARVPLSDAWAVTARVQRAIRPPDLVELYGDRGVIRGNPDLRAERSVQVDASLVFTPSDTVRASVTPYWIARQDGIVYVQNAQRTAMPINLDRSGRMGVEAALNATEGVVDLRTALALTHSVNRSRLPAYAGRRLPRTPVLVLDHATGLVLGPWRLGHTVHISTSRYLDAANQTPSPGRMLHGAFVRGTLTDGLTLELAVRNLGDERVQGTDRNPLDDQDNTRVLTAITDFTGYPLPGRTWLLSLRWTP